MKNTFALSLLLLFTSFQLNAQEEYLGIQKNEIELSVNQHLNLWFPLIIDSINGGYYTNFESDWAKSKNQTKMLVTQARGLYTASKAAQLLDNSKLYKNAAHHGYQFLTQKMWDKKRGGFYLYYQIEKPRDKTPYKLIYANAFALFALSEYAKINPSEEVFIWIDKTFDWIDSVAHDDKQLGYYNLVLNDELKKNTPENKKTLLQINWGDPEWKDQNTSIHLLEALTTCYQVMPVSKIEKRLKEMLSLVRDTITRANGTLKLNFMKNWAPIDYGDSTKSYILEHQYFDHISFGHNIETAYLIIDAAKTLFGEVDSTSLKVAKVLTDHTLKYGFAPNFYGLYDRGYQFEKEGEVEIIDSRKAWWSQFEACHTLALLSNYYPQEKVYETAFSNMWNYIQVELHDSKHGGYYNFGLDTAPQNKKDKKAHQWKGPYHDGRALMQVWQYSLQP